MEQKPTVLIIEHGGRSYIAITANYYYSDGKNVAANGVTGLPKAPGDQSFLMFDGAPVETLQRITPPRRIITKYVLRGDLKGSSKEEVVSVEQRSEMSDADQCLYVAVHEDIPQQAEDIPFLVQREDGPPSLLPKGVTSIDKSYFARAPAFWHLGPVRASAKYVLWRTAKRLDEVIKGNRLIKWSIGWGGDIDKYLSDFHSAFFIEVAPLTVNGMEVSPKGFRTMFTTDAKDRNLTYSTLIQAIDGANLDDLEAKVAAQVEALVGPSLRWVSPDKCPCCQRRFKAKAGAA